MSVAAVDLYELRHHVCIVHRLDYATATVDNSRTLGHLGHVCMCIELSVRHWHVLRLLVLLVVLLVLGGVRRRDWKVPKSMVVLVLVRRSRLQMRYRHWGGELHCVIRPSRRHTHSPHSPHAHVHTMADVRCVRKTNHSILAVVVLWPANVVHHCRGG